MAIDVRRVEQLERQQQMLTQLARLILENKLEGAEGAAGLVVALEGGQTSIEVRLGKGDGSDLVVPLPPARSPIVQKRSANFSPGRPNGPPIALVLHTMAGTLAGSDSWFANPASAVSAHYGVGLDGAIHQYVHVGDQAWANGVLQAGARWPGPMGINPNSLSVSIETEDLGQASTPVSDAMFASVLDLCEITVETYPNIRYLVGHSAISPGTRANCPGQRWTTGRVQTLAATLGLQLVL